LTKQEHFTNSRLSEFDAWFADSKIIRGVGDLDAAERFEGGRGIFSDPSEIGATSQLLRYENSSCTDEAAVGDDVV